MMANVFPADRPEEQIARLFTLIGQPARLQILQMIGAQEACVCHLEAALGMRQAAISQHLKVLREAGWVRTRRVGRNIFYTLSQPQILHLIRQSAALLGVDPREFHPAAEAPIPGCPCPHCNPGADPNLAC